MFPGCVAIVSAPLQTASVRAPLQWVGPSNVRGALTCTRIATPYVHFPVPVHLYTHDLLKCIQCVNIPAVQHFTRLHAFVWHAHSLNLLVWEQCDELVTLHAMILQDHLEAVTPGVNELCSHHAHVPNAAVPVKSEEEDDEEDRRDGEDVEMEEDKGEGEDKGEEEWAGFSNGEVEEQESSNDEEVVHVLHHCHLRSLARGGN